MDHLTDDQLSARLDAALPVAEAARADAHLEQCESCRARLAELGASDSALASALTHDPGEAYFESFADRVRSRIAADTAAAPAPVPTRVGGFWAWFGSPRRLASMGGALAFVVVAGLAWQMFQRGPTTPVAMDAPMLQSAPSEDAGSSEPAPATPSDEPPSPTPAASEAESRAAAPGAATPRQSLRSAAPGRMQEMRSVEGGESVPVTRERDRLFARDAARDVAPPVASDQQSAITELKRRMVAQPMTRTDDASKQKEQADARAEEATADAVAPREAAPKAPATATTTERLGQTLARTRALTAKRTDETGNASGAPAPAAPGVAGSFDEDVSSRAGEDGSQWCGDVRDSQGRAVLGATVTVIETGRSAQTDAAGHFCLPAAGRDATLSVLAMGFEPQRILMRGTGGVQPLAIALKAVSALGEGLAVPRDPAWRAGTPIDVAPAARWDSVAVRADDALSRAKGAASRLAAMRTAADARLRAWRAQPSAQRAISARAAIDRYLGQLPEGPRRAEALRWREQLPR